MTTKHIIYSTGIDGSGWKAWRAPQGSGWTVKPYDGSDSAFIGQTVAYQPGSDNGDITFAPKATIPAGTSVYTVATTIQVYSTSHDNPCFDAGKLLFSARGYKLVVCDGYMELRYIDAQGNVGPLTLGVNQEVYKEDFQPHTYLLWQANNQACMQKDANSSTRLCVPTDRSLGGGGSIGVASDLTEAYYLQYSVLNVVPQ